jgi:magnesium-transporting ATPase (P-type)
MENTTQVSNELQQKISQLTKLMTWLLIGGVATLGMALLKFFTGEFDPMYHSIEAAIGLYCLATWVKSYYGRQKLLQQLRVAETASDSVRS